jgi:glycosidase
MADDLSILNWFREVIAVRNAFPVIARGRVEASNISTDTVAAFYKVAPEERNVFIIINLGDEEVSCDLSSEADGYSMVAVLNTSEEWITVEENKLMLPGHSIAVFAEDLD